MVKPVKKYPTQKMYNYNEVISYIEKKYGYNTTDFLGKFSGDKSKSDNEYQNFWHWITDNNQISNGGSIYISFDYIYNGETKDFVKKILKDIKTEFDPDDQEDSLLCWVEW